jgi:hypothetical protein
MKAYGVDRKDTGCCPGHDKFCVGDCYNSRVSEHARAKSKRVAHKRARARSRVALHRELAA